MSCDDECLSSEVASELKEIPGKLQKDSRISYARDYLLSFAEEDDAKELPTGFDQSILRELDDACKSTPEHQKLLGLDSLSTGNIWSDSSRDSSDKWSSKSTDNNDHGKIISNQFGNSWQKPENTANLKSLQNSEQNGILGSWSASKLPSSGSEASILKLPGTDGCLLSRCKEPYRPPSFYKAMNHSQNHEPSSNEACGCAECLRKKRTMEGNLRKDTCLVLEEHLAAPAITSKQNPPGTSPAVSGSVECPCFAEEASEKCRIEESPVRHPLLQDPVVQVQQIPYQSQLIKMDSGVAIDAEKLQGQVLEGGRFSALINLEEAEDIDAYFLDEANLASNDSSRDKQSVKEANVGFGILEKKELRNYAAYSGEATSKIANNLQVKALKKTTSNSLADVSISSTSSIKPSSSLQLASVAQEYKGNDIASKDLRKANSPLIYDPKHSDSDIWQLPRCTKKHDVVVDDRDTYRSKSRFIHFFPDNEKSDCNISPGAGKDGEIVSGVSTGKSMMENLLCQRKPMEASTYGQKAPFSKKTKAGIFDCPSSTHAVQSNRYLDGIRHDSWSVQMPELDKIAEEADSSLEINLPDEDSLITIDDTYIFQQEEPNPPKISIRGGSGVSSFPVSNKLVGSESVQQNVILPDLWFQESQINSKNILVHSSDSQTHVYAPPIFHDPWKIHHNDYNPFAFVSPPFARLPLKPQNSEPSVEALLSPIMPQADKNCPDLDQILSADPSIYHQFLQIPCCNQEPHVLRSLPLNYQTNGKATMDVGRRGLLGEERNKSTINQCLQMQRKLAQMNLEAAEQRAYSKAVSNCFW